MNDEKMNYAIIGGIAVYTHGYERTTNNCDILLARSDYEKFINKFVGRNLKPRFQGAKKKFIETDTKTNVDIILEGEYPGDGKEGSIAFPNPATCREHLDNMNVITLPKLIDLKLASYQSLGVRRAKDLADVVELIKYRELDRSFADLLHPNVRSIFVHLVTQVNDGQNRGPLDDD